MAKQGADKQKERHSESTGDRLRRLRTARGLTQTELGRLVDVTQRVITYYENENGSLSPELLAKLAEALKVTADEILGRGKAVTGAEDPIPENLRLWRRLRRVTELPPRDRKVVLDMIDALADRSTKRRAS